MGLAVDDAIALLDRCAADGLGRGEVAAGPEAVATPPAVAGFDGGPTCGGFRTATPTAFRYVLAVSRRTPVARSIFRSDHPSRPRASTC